MSLLNVRGLHLAYGRVRALQGESLQVDPGAIVALLGVKGAGKSRCWRTSRGFWSRRPG